MEIAYIGLGSNLDNPMNQVKAAFLKIANIEKTHCLAYSSLYLSPPLGLMAQPDYVNAVVKLSTELSAEKLLNALFEVENAHHRQRRERWGARTLDCDLLLYGQHIIHKKKITVPHPEMTQRSFVLLPLAEIEPNLVLPNGQTLTSFLARCDISALSKIID
jgi:2-amino-4-hydroxy-6-hydroxymethyldihydropteridine diphosphokinase